MKLRSKNFLVVNATLGLVLVLVFFLAPQFLTLSYRSLENDKILDEIDRVKAVLNHDAENLQATAKDYAVWDDSYRFIKGEFVEYPEVNITQDSLSNLNINLAALFDAEGKPVYFVLYDADFEETITAPADFEKYFFPKSPMLSYPPAEINYGQSGIINFDDMPMMVAVHTVLSSMGEGPVGGFIVFGRYLNEANIKSLSDLAGFPFGLLPYDQAQLPTPLQADFAQLKALLFLTDIQSRETIASYSLVNDIFGQPAQIVEIHSSRTIYQKGLETVNYFLTGVLTLMILVSLGLSLLLDRIVMRRLTQLSDFIKKVNLSGDLSLKIPVRGNDEISRLIELLNSLLKALKQSNDSLLTTQQRLERQNKELEKSLKLMVGRELKMVELKKKVKSLGETGEEALPHAAVK